MAAAPATTRSALTAFVNNMSESVAPTAPPPAPTPPIAVPLSALVGGPSPFVITRDPPPLTAPAALEPPKPRGKWFQSPYFVKSVAVLGVFLVSFVLLISIRPQFVYSYSDDDAQKRYVSMTKVSLWSLGTAVVAIVIMVIAGVVAAKQRKRA